ncbi:MAG TPA: hypothetical protein VHF26_16380, partial [Trebonia sp.]|nr:hypothetical protein [Trebonia sp.]
EELGIPAEAGSTVGAARKPQTQRRSGDRNGTRPEQKSERPARRSGTRRRTRGGQAVTAHPSGNGAASTDGDATPETPAASPPGNAGSTRRRRRRRKPAEGQAATAAAATTQSN